MKKDHLWDKKENKKNLKTNKKKKNIVQVSTNIRLLKSKWKYMRKEKRIFDIYSYY